VRSGGNRGLNVGGSRLPLGPLLDNEGEDKVDGDEQEHNPNDLDGNYQEDEESNGCGNNTLGSGQQEMDLDEAILLPPRPCCSERAKKGEVKWGNGIPPPLSPSAARIICTLATILSPTVQRKLALLLLALCPKTAMEALELSNAPMSLPALAQQCLQLEKTASVASFYLMTTQLQITVRINE
jgi:hypothetical protein